MNAAAFRRWAEPLLEGGASAARAEFLALPARWEAAAGPGHFFESSASSRAPHALKLALILDAPPAALSASRSRDASGKASQAAALIAVARKEGGRHDADAAARALGLLARWRLRGSLMISGDFDRKAGTFGKISLYAYLPEPGALKELVEALAPGAAPVRTADHAGDDLEFWALDLWPDGARALKLYHRVPYAPAAVPAALRRFGEALAGLGTVRDVTRLTRLSEPRAAARDAAEKVYFGLEDGVELAALTRLRLPGQDAFLRGLAALAPGQRAYFIGLGGEDVEVYFDRRAPAAAPARPGGDAERAG